MEKEIVVTTHAYQRAEERLSLGETAFKRLATIAYNNGLKHADVKGRLKRYVDKLWISHKNGNAIRVYGEVIYIFNSNSQVTTLITVYQLPLDLRKYVSLSSKKGVKTN